jgi:hypothetical protein
VADEVISQLRPAAGSASCEIRFFGHLDILGGILSLTPNFSWVKHCFVLWNRFSGFPRDGNGSCLLAMSQDKPLKRFIRRWLRSTQLKLGVNEMPGQRSTENVEEPFFSGFALTKRVPRR